MRRRLNPPMTLMLAFALLGVAALAAGLSAEAGAARERPVPATAGEDGAGRARDNAAAVGRSPAAAARGAGGAGMRVYLDPETGALRTGPRAPLAEGEERGPLSPAERLNTYGGDLLQEALPDGGFKVDLRGRFQTSVVATIDPATDEVSIDCVERPVGAAATGEGQAGHDR